MVNDILNSISNTFSNFDAFDNKIGEAEEKKVAKKEKTKEKIPEKKEEEIVKHGPSSRDFLLDDLLLDDFVRL